MNPIWLLVLLMILTFALLIATSAGDDWEQSQGNYNSQAHVVRFSILFVCEGLLLAGIVAFQVSQKI